MKISVLFRIAALGSLLALSACGRSGRLVPAPKETPIVTTAEPLLDDPTSPAASTPTDTTPVDSTMIDEDVPTTPEEIRHRKAETIVAEQDLPAEMSRDDMIRFIEETENRLPLEPETETPKTEANPEEKPTGGLLTVEPEKEEPKKEEPRVSTASTTPTTTTSPKVEIPKFQMPTLPPAKIDHTAVRKPIIPILKTETPKPAPKTETKPTAWVWPTIPPKKTEPTTPKTTPSPIPQVKPETKKPDAKTTTPPAKKEEPKVEPKKDPKPKTQTETPPIEKNPPVQTDPTAANDNGVDAEDEKFEEEYAGPKTVVDHPASTAEYQLSEVAAQLGQMTKTKYLALQKDKIGTKVKSCNFFFVVALIEAKAPDAKGKIATSKNYPGSMAAQLDTTYFQPAGWERISLEDLKQWFRDGRAFDVAIQRDAPKGKKHGHVAVPIGLNADGNVMVAEASYLTVSNRIAVYSDSSLKSKFKIFARWAK